MKIESLDQDIRTLLSSRSAFLVHQGVVVGEEGAELRRPVRQRVVATSGANHCQYCVVAHGAILRVRARNPLIVGSG